MTARHRLADVLAERSENAGRPGHRADGHRVALAVEGGGMRGTVSAGMDLALRELGLLPLFDAVYGASAGAISAAWLLSSRPEGLRGWTEPAFARALIRKRNVLLGRPLGELSRENKQRAVRLLEDRGAFLLRRSVDDVADALAVSRITVYNYLNAMRGEPLRRA